MSFVTLIKGNFYYAVKKERRKIMINIKHKHLVHFLPDDPSNHSSTSEETHDDYGDELWEDWGSPIENIDSYDD